MKLEIDLNDIMNDEYGNASETLQESIRRQVVDAIAKPLQQQIKDRINEETSRILNEQLQAVLAAEMPAIVADVMNSEFTPVDRYGQRSQPTTFRTELIAAIHKNMKYEKRQFSSDNNAFTEAVDGLVEAKIATFKADFDKSVNATFTAAALEYAAEAVRKRLGIK